MAEVSLAKVNEALQAASRARSMATRVREHAEQQIGAFVRSTEVSASAFTWGLLQGRYGDLRVRGVPLEMAAGILAHTAGLFGIMEDHAHAVGDGSLASYFHSVGRGAGLEWWVKAGKPARMGSPDKSVTSEVTETTTRGAAGPSDDELARQIRGAR